MSNTKTTTRGFLFKIYNPKVEDVPTLKWKHSKYIIYQKGKGDDGTPFIQGYVHFKQAVRFSHVKKLIKRAEWTSTKDINLIHSQAVKKYSDVGGPIEESIVVGSMEDVAESIRKCYSCNPPDARQGRAMGIAKNPLIPIQDIEREYPDLWERYKAIYINLRFVHLSDQSDQKTTIHWIWGSDNEQIYQKALEMTMSPFAVTDIKVNNDCKHPDIIRTQEYVRNSYFDLGDGSDGSVDFKYKGEEDVILHGIPPPSPNVSRGMWFRLMRTPSYTIKSSDFKWGNHMFWFERLCKKSSKNVSLLRPVQLKPKRLIVTAPQPPSAYSEKVSALVDVVEEFASKKRKFEGSYVEGFEPPSQKPCSFIV